MRGRVGASFILFLALPRTESFYAVIAVDSVRSAVRCYLGNDISTVLSLPLK